MSFCVCIYPVQQLEKEGAKAISLQPDEPVIFEDESYVMGKKTYFSNIICYNTQES